MKIIIQIIQLVVLTCVSTNVPLSFVNLQHMLITFRICLHHLTWEHVYLSNILEISADNWLAGHLSTLLLMALSFYQGDSYLAMTKIALIIFVISLMTNMRRWHILLLVQHLATLFTLFMVSCWYLGSVVYNASCWVRFRGSLNSPSCILFFCFLLGMFLLLPQFFLVCELLFSCGGYWRRSICNPWHLE
jgi:hypothetical protein